MDTHCAKKKEDTGADVDQTTNKRSGSLMTFLSLLTSIHSASVCLPGVCVCRWERKKKSLPCYLTRSQRHPAEAPPLRAPFSVCVPLLEQGKKKCIVFLF